MLASRKKLETKQKKRRKRIYGHKNKSWKVSGIFISWEFLPQNCMAIGYIVHVFVYDNITRYINVLFPDYSITINWICTCPELNWRDKIINLIIVLMSQHKFDLIYDCVPELPIIICGIWMLKAAAHITSQLKGKKLKCFKYLSPDTFQ